MALSTDIRLEGDQYRARKLAHAQVNRLLTIFRRTNEFQDLKFNTHAENFFDETGKYIGTIHLLTSHGIEVVTVDVPPIVKREKKEEIWLKKPEHIEQIVPVMRSVDNRYWVACLSGSFDGPYYAFENIYEIPAEEMADNAEGELDNRLISTGAFPLNGVDSPELFFIAQTGVKPDTDDIAETEDSRYQTSNEDVTFRAYMVALPYTSEYCIPTGKYHGMYAIDFDYDDTFFRQYTVWGKELSLQRKILRYIKNLLGPGVRGATEGSLQNFGGMWVRSLDFVVSTIKGISVEQDDVENFACCYAGFTIDDTHTSSEPYDSCRDWDRTWVTKGYDYTINKSFYFQIEDNDFKFYTSPSYTETPRGYNHPWADSLFIGDYPSDTCSVEDNMIKYYGSESGTSTGIMCGRIEAADRAAPEADLENERCLEFIYNYVGPSTEEDINSTHIIPDNGAYEHIMANVQGIDDTVIFKGEIFLGRIRLSSEETIKIL